jgi:hypothetical protein
LETFDSRIDARLTAIPSVGHSDQEYSSASLGDSEPLGVEDSPAADATGSNNHARDRPAFTVCTDEGFILSNHCGQEMAECVVWHREDARHVFPNNNSWVEFVADADELRREVTPFIGSPLSFSGDADTLTGASSYHHVAIG